MGGGDKGNYKALWEPFLLSISLQQCEGALRRTPTKEKFSQTENGCVERPRNIEERFFLPQESFSQKRPPSHENNSHLQWYAVREISVWELHIWHPHEATTYDFKALYKALLWEFLMSYFTSHINTSQIRPKYYFRGRCRMLYFYELTKQVPYK